VHEAAISENQLLMEVNHSDSGTFNSSVLGRMQGQTV